MDIVIFRQAKKKINAKFKVTNTKVDVAKTKINPISYRFNIMELKPDNDSHNQLIEELNKINFNWENVVHTANGIDKYWQAKFDLLVKYKNDFDSVSVPQSNKEIGRWVNDQRVNFKRNKLSPQKIKMLDDIGFIWVAKK